MADPAETPRTLIRALAADSEQRGPRTRTAAEKKQPPLAPSRSPSTALSPEKQADEDDGPAARTRSARRTASAAVGKARGADNDAREGPADLEKKEEEEMEKKMTTRENDQEVSGTEEGRDVREEPQHAAEETPASVSSTAMKRTMRSRIPRETPRTMIRAFLNEAPEMVRSRESLAAEKAAANQVGDEARAEAVITTRRTSPRRKPVMSTPGTQVQTVSVEDAAKLSSRNRVTDNDNDDDDDDAFFAVSAAAPKDSKLAQGAADSQRQDLLANRSGNAAVTDEGQTGNERLGGGGDEDEDEDAFRAAEKDLAIERRPRPDRRRRRRRTLIPPELLSEEKPSRRDGSLHASAQQQREAGVAEVRAGQRARRALIAPDLPSEEKPRGSLRDKENNTSAEVIAFQRPRRGKRALEDPYALIATPMDGSASSTKPGETPASAGSFPGASPASILSVSGPGATPASSIAPLSFSAARDMSSESKSLASEATGAFATPSVLPKFTLLAGSTLQERVTPEWRKRAMARPNMPLPPLFEEDEEGEDIFPARKKMRKRKPRTDRGKSRASAEAIVGGEEAAKVPRVPHLPDIFVKKVWTNLLKARDFSSNGNATARAVMRASAAFFEQAADDLASYADHGGRRTIEMSDVRCLFARQRLIAGDLDEALADLARKHLPREFADEVIDALE